MAPNAAKSRIARFGLFEADLQQRVLAREGLRVKLQDQPFEVLSLLLQRPGEIVTREEIQQKLWPADTYVAFDDGLNTAIKKLRLALGDSAENPRFIETAPRRGYRFLASPVFVETNAIGQPDREVHQLPSVGNELAADVSGEVEAPKAGSRRRVLLWAGLLFAAALFVTGSMTWRKHVVAASLQSAETNANLKLDQPDHLAKRPTRLRAREEYVQARLFWKLRTAEALSQAVDHYNHAIELDPNYAEAYAGLANCYIVLPMLSGFPVEDSYVKARQAAKKALELDDSVAEAHLATAEISFYVDWNFPAAEKEFRRAVELDTNDAQAHQWYGEFLSLMGRHREAIAQVQAAEHLDPSSMIIHHQAGQTFQSARMYSEALVEYRRALMIQPGFGPTYSTIALAYRRLNRYPECLEAQRQANLYWDPGGTALQDLPRVVDAYRAGGKLGYLRAALEFEKKNHASTYQLAQDYALLGENDQALRWLQKTLDAHLPEILNVRNDPEFDHLRSDPRFREIVARVGLPLTTEPVAESMAKRQAN